MTTIITDKKSIPKTLSFTFAQNHCNQNIFLKMENMYYNNEAKRTTQPLDTLRIVVAKEKTLRKMLIDISMKLKVKNLVIGEGCGNGIDDKLEIHGFHNMESIVIMKKALRNIEGLIISSNNKLRRIEIENGDMHSGTGALGNVLSVEISGMITND